MADEVAQRLRERLAGMTTHAWLVRVAELRQAVESRDRVIAEQQRTIDRLRAIGDELRATVARLEAEQAGTAASAAPKPARPGRRRRDASAGGPASEKA